MKQVTWTIKELNEEYGPLNDKKKQELYSLKLLDKEYGPIPKPNPKSESPDLLISYPDHILGIECTTIYSENEVNGIPLKQHESIKWKIIRKAKELAEERGIPPVHVQVSFSGAIEKSREGEIAEEIALAIKANSPESGQQITIGGIGSSYTLPDELRRICILNLPDCDNHYWHVVDSGWVQRSFTKQLQAIIDSKSKKLASYLEQCHRCWLIISAVGNSPSSFYNPSDETLKHTYNSPFERVFFMEEFDRKVYELHAAGCPE